jgi:hypothetical protein
MGGLGKLLGIVILIPFIFLTASYIDADMTATYIDSGISPIQPLNQTNLGGTNITYEDFDKSNEVNKSIGPILDAFQKLSNKDGGGFFSKIGDLAIAIPLAVIKLPSAMVEILSIAIDYTTNIALILGIPQPIIALGVLGLMTFITIALISFWRRHTT